MDTGDKLFYAGMAYAAIALVVFGFVVKTMAAALQGGAVVLGFFVAAVWPASALIWLGAWLA